VRYTIPTEGTNEATHVYGFDGIWIYVNLKTRCIDDRGQRLIITYLTMSGSPFALVRIREGHVPYDSYAYSPHCCVTIVTNTLRSSVILAHRDYEIDVIGIGDDIMRVACQLH
jgi:hypothetical protein